MFWELLLVLVLVFQIFHFQSSICFSVAALGSNTSLPVEIRGSVKVEEKLG